MPPKPMLAETVQGSTGAADGVRVAARFLI
jgi:hypothetical protein